MWFVVNVREECDIVYISAEWVMSIGQDQRVARIKEELLYKCRNSPMEGGYYAGKNHKHLDRIFLHTQ